MPSRSGLSADHELMQFRPITFMEYKRLSERLRYWFVHRLEIDTTGFRHITDDMLNDAYNYTDFIKKRAGIRPADLDRVEYQFRDIHRNVSPILTKRVMASLCLHEMVRKIMVVQTVLAIMDTIIEFLKRSDQDYEKKIETYELIFKEIHKFRGYDEEGADAIDVIDRLIVEDMKLYEKLNDVNMRDYTSPELLTANPNMFEEDKITP